ncbi:MAG: cytochrome c3 family protein [Terriglobales bacterium]
MREHWRLTLIVLALLGFGAWKLLGMGENVGYSPVQPIPFSHKLHAGDNHIPCQYCHAGVDRSRLAPIPALNVCMGCHAVVDSNAAPIQKVAASYAALKPIDWVRVYDLPQFVYFQHRWHIAAGIACQTCHGPVQEMDQIRQVQQWTMAQCLNCHRNNDYLPTPDDRYHRDPATFHNRPANAPQDCNVCHN